MLQRDDVIIMLHETSSIKHEYPVLTEGSPGGNFVTYISVDDIESLFTHFDKAFVIKEIHTTFYNMREFSIQDNNGYVLTFAARAS